MDTDYNEKVPNILVARSYRLPIILLMLTTAYGIILVTPVYVLCFRSLLVSNGCVSCLVSIKSYMLFDIGKSLQHCTY